MTPKTINHPDEVLASAVPQLSIYQPTDGIVSAPILLTSPP
jgi:hypothetical protein